MKLDTEHLQLPIGPRPTVTLTITAPAVYTPAGENAIAGCRRALSRIGACAVARFFRSTRRLPPLTALKPAGSPGTGAPGPGCAIRARCAPGGSAAAAAPGSSPVLVDQELSVLARAWATASRVAVRASAGMVLNGIPETTTSTWSMPSACGGLPGRQHRLDHVQARVRQCLAQFAHEIGIGFHRHQPASSGSCASSARVIVPTPGPSSTTVRQCCQLTGASRRWTRAGAHREGADHARA